MRNLEWKSRLTDLAGGERAAQALGATFGGDLYQLDTYFQVGRGRLKLRETGDGRGELIFYDRPEHAPTRWSDYFKASIADAAAIRDVLTRALGVPAQVEKTRRLYLFRGARIHLDRVTGLGTFIEFEVPVEAGSAGPPGSAEPISVGADETPGSSERLAGGHSGRDDAVDVTEAARARMRELMEAFGLTDADAITSSYGEMIEARR